MPQISVPTPTNMAMVVDMIKGSFRNLAKQAQSEATFAVAIRAVPDDSTCVQDGLGIDIDVHVTFPDGVFDEDLWHDFHAYSETLGAQLNQGNTTGEGKITIHVKSEPEA